MFMKNHFPLRKNHESMIDSHTLLRLITRIYTWMSRFLTLLVHNDITKETASTFVEAESITCYKFNKIILAFYNSNHFEERIL